MFRACKPTPVAPIWAITECLACSFIHVCWFPESYLFTEVPRPNPTSPTLSLSSFYPCKAILNEINVWRVQSLGVCTSVKILFKFGGWAIWRHLAAAAWYCRGCPQRRFSTAVQEFRGLKFKFWLNVIQEQQQSAEFCVLYNKCVSEKRLFLIFAVM